jgi:hypothetical protein
MRKLSRSINRGDAVCSPRKIVRWHCTSEWQRREALMLWKCVHAPSSASWEEWSRRTTCQKGVWNADAARALGTRRVTAVMHLGEWHAGDALPSGKCVSRNQQLNCCSCGVNHTANYRGCSSWKEAESLVAKDAPGGRAANARPLELRRRRWNPSHADSTSSTSQSQSRLKGTADPVENLTAEAYIDLPRHLLSTASLRTGEGRSSAILKAMILFIAEYGRAA